MAFAQVGTNLDRSAGAATDGARRPLPHIISFSDTYLRVVTPVTGAPRVGLLIARPARVWILGEGSARRHYPNLPCMDRPDEEVAIIRAQCQGAVHTRVGPPIPIAQDFESRRKPVLG